MMVKSMEFPQYEFRPPASFTSGRKLGQPTVIFIHTTEGSEGRTSAEAGAAYDNVRDDGTSTHFFVDQDSTIQCVYTFNEAHTARAHGNDVGIQIEVCGRAGQTTAQWEDAASAGAIEQAAILSVALRGKYGKARFPLRNLTPAELRDGARGFAEHLDATLAWPGDRGTHSDPGPNFPWGKLFNRITELEAGMNEQTIATAVWDAAWGRTTRESAGDKLIHVDDQVDQIQAKLTEILAAVNGVDEAVMEKIGNPATSNEEVAATMTNLLGALVGEERMTAILELMRNP